MSRYTVTLAENKSFNFGYDHALGYWYDIFDEAEEFTIVEKCAKFNKLTGNELADIIEATITPRQQLMYGLQIVHLRNNVSI